MTYAENGNAKIMIGDGFVSINAAPAFAYMKVRQEGDVPPYPATLQAKRTTVVTALRLGYMPEQRDALFG